MILQISQKVVNFLFINYTVFLFDILTSSLSTICNRTIQHMKTMF